MSQLRHPVSTCATCAVQWKMWLFKVFGVIYMVAVCASEDNDATTYSYSDSKSTAPPPFVPPVPVLEQTPSSSDFFSSEKVVLECKATSSSELIFTWKKNGSPLGSGPDLSQYPDKSVLTITSASPQDSGNYTCVVEGKKKPSQTKESGPVNIQVNEIPVPTITETPKWAHVFPTESVKFKCGIGPDSHNWIYTWYRDGTQVNADGTVSFNTNGAGLSISSASAGHTGKYNCSGKIQNRAVTSQTSSEVSLTVYAEKPTLTLTRDPDYDVMFAGEAVNFSCAISVQSEWTYLWYKDGSEVTGSSDKLVVQIRGTADGGSYTCNATRGQNPTFITDSSVPKQLKVQENKPKPSMTQQPDAKKLYVGENVSFECKVENSDGWSYDWYKDGASILTNSNSLKMERLDLSKEGVYKCKAKRDKTGFNTEFSDQRTLQISEIPVPTLKLVTKWPDVFPTENVNMRCEMQTDSADWTYAFYRDGTKVQDYNSATDTRSLSITSASASDRGNYSCSGKLKIRDVYSITSSPLKLNVYAQKPTLTLTRDPEYDVMFAGEAVTFSCAISVPSEWKYLWYKDNSQVTGSSDKLTVQINGTADEGSYTCKATRGQNPAFITDSSGAKQLKVQAQKPTLTLTRDPEYNVMFAGEAVTFSCAISVQSEWTYLWYKDGNQITESSDKLVVQIRGTADGGSYTCKATRGQNPTFITDLSGAKQLKVQAEKPTLTLTRDPNYDVMFAGESVNFSCAISVHSEWKYLWYKDGSQVTGSSDKLTVQINGTADGGSYTCKATRGQNPAFITDLSAAKQLKVQDAKPTVTLEQNPAHNLMHSEDSVSFNCHVNVSSGWEYLWYKDDKELVLPGNNYNITSVTTKDSGSYKCKVSRGTEISKLSNIVKLKVEERPKASIVLLTGWSDVFSTDSLILLCEVKESTHNWTNYTWLKEEGKIDSFSEKHAVTPSNDPDQSTYTCRAHADERPLYSKSSDSFKTKNLLLKRRVLLSISGCIVFGIAAVFIGCVALRVFRKPNGRDDKMEEVNLFPTMAELKITDVPCPLVEYITDASLNAPAKEEEENGTVCNETTPLPITKQEDQAATTDNQETTETNGGLSSFLK
ncbi:unnamed protein product [Oreochromis niloticus]|nr:unnamed protein product [Mustela putorius furo]